MTTRADRPGSCVRGTSSPTSVDFVQCPGTKTRYHQYHSFLLRPGPR